MLYLYDTKVLNEYEHLQTKSEKSEDKRSSEIDHDGSDFPHNENLLLADAAISCEVEGKNWQEDLDTVIKNETPENTENNTSGDLMENNCRRFYQSFLNGVQILLYRVMNMLSKSLQQRSINASSFFVVR